ncbi:MAG: prepilin-type N-terminal cleavage/methylation domain-containing protein [bacterium]|nr:prepilin-type N-terminal cleavage/methylation domain-containing protein [bacterium]
MKNTINKNQKSGFTLIEVVIAIAILAVITTVTYSALTQIIRSKNVLDDRRELNSVAYALLNRMVRELQLAYSGIGLMPDEPEGKQRAQNINMIGEQKVLLNQKRGDTLQFLALEGGQYLPDGGAHSGLVQLRYRVEENPELKNKENQTFLLIRDETPLTRPFEKAFSKRMIFPIVDNLVTLQYRYFDAEESKWLDSWEEDKNFGLPTQIEIRIEMLSPNGEIHSFVTAVPLRSINAVPNVNG